MLLKYFKKEFLYRIPFGLCLLLLFPLLLCAQNNKGQTVSIPTSSRQHISLDADWKFHFGHAADPAKDFENSTSLDVMSHGYKPVGGLYPQNSVGWYRKLFKISRTDSGQRFSIQFDGIYRDSKVWINGYYLGSNASGYTGVCYDITNYIR